MNTRIVLIVALTVAGCRDTPRGHDGSCQPLAVTVDGKPLPAMPHGLARSNNYHGNVSFEVDVFNHDKSTCAELVGKMGRVIPDGEVSVRALAGGTDLGGKGVAIGAYTQAGVDAELVGPKPKAAGDRVAICVGDATFKPTLGEYKDKQVHVTGLFSGTYCGELTW